VVEVGGTGVVAEDRVAVMVAVGAEGEGSVGVKVGVELEVGDEVGVEGPRVALGVADEVGVGVAGL
jgi:hypothetical protein